jgi:hypothetical protein
VKGRGQEGKVQDRIDYWKELMAVFREARAHYAQIISFSLAAIVATLTIAFTVSGGEDGVIQEKLRLVLLAIVTFSCAGVACTHLIFLKELNVLQGQISKVQPKIENNHFDVTYALRNTVLTSLVIFIFIGLLYLLLGLFN